MPCASYCQLPIEVQDGRCIWCEQRASRERCKVAAPRCIHLLQISLTCGLGLATIVDLMVSISLVYYRLKVPRRADQAMHFVERLQYFAINTGVLTMLVSLASVLTYAVLRPQPVYIGVLEIQAKRASHCCLVTPEK